PVSSIDFFPTLLAMAGVTVGQAADGVNLDGVLRGTAQPPARPLFWHYPHYSNQARSPGAPVGGGPGAAMRDGEWKLSQHFETGFHELYDLSADPGERNNLADAMSERVLDLGKRLHAWQGSVKVQWPKYHPEFKPAPVRQLADGSILLHAREAIIHGQNVQYEPQPHKNTVGF